MTLHHSIDDTVLRRQSIYQKLEMVLILLLMVAAAGSLSVLYLQNNKLTELANSANANSALLVECTTPPELRHPPVVIDASGTAADCYVRTRAETGQVVQNIRTISIAAAACGAANPGNVKATEACVSKTLGDK